MHTSLTSSITSSLTSGLTGAVSSALDRGRESRLLRRLLPSPRTGPDPCAAAALTVHELGRTDARPAGGPHRLSVSGELDVWTAPVLAAELGRLVGRRPGAVVLDLAALRFCDVVGVRTLLEVADRVADRGGAVRLQHPCWSLEVLLRRWGRSGLLAP